MNPARILVVEDEPNLLTTVRLYLLRYGFRVIEATDGQMGLDLALREKPSLVILDLGLPLLDGLEVCARLRHLEFESPILMLTSRHQIADRVRGLNTGADDYLPKPFEPQELIARITALLRRHHRETVRVLVLELGNIRIDLENRTATQAGNPLPLTKTEYALLSLLAKHAGQPVSREHILDVIWGCTRFPTTRTVDTHIWRLRKKLRDDGENPRWIKRTQGQGYYLAISTATA